MKKIDLSEIKKKIIRPPKINGETEIFRSSVMALLFENENGLNLIFEKRSSKVKQKNEVSFPGGHFEEEIDGNTRETAIRETVEELGLARERIEVLGQLDTLVNPMRAIIDAYAGFCDIKNIDELNVDKEEVEYAFSVPVKFFLETEPDVYPLIVRAHPSIIDKNGEEKILFPVKELGLPESYAKPWGEAEAKVLVYKFNGEVIWGITAKIVSDFIGRLK